MDKLLTVSIANYNNASKLDNSISSLLDDEILGLIEVIVVNDGSKDNSMEVIDKYVKKYPHTVKVIDKENGGYGSTINASLKIAKGKYYRLLDADDKYNTSNLVEFIKQLKIIDTDIIYSDFSFVNASSGKKEEVTFDYPKNEIMDVSIIKKIHMHALTVKTSLIQNKINITEHCFYTDIEFSTKAMKESDSFVYLPLEVYLYNIGDNEQSVSKAGYIKHAYEHEKIMRIIIDIAKSDKKFDNLIKYHFTDLLNDQFFIYMFDKKFKDNFYEYASYMKQNNPEILKKAKIYIKLAVKSKLFYTIFAKLV